jgi:hypothetical protein
MSASERTVKVMVVGRRAEFSRMLDRVSFSLLFGWNLMNLIQSSDGFLACCLVSARCRCASCCLAFVLPRYLYEDACLRVLSAYYPTMLGQRETNEQFSEVPYGSRSGLHMQSLVGLQLHGKFYARPFTWT